MLSPQSMRLPLSGEDSPLSRLEIGRYRFNLRAETPICLPAFAGSTWRGAFGMALRQANCITGLPACEPCPQQQGCVYRYLFETPPPPDAEKMRRYPSVPHPYVFRVGADDIRVLSPGEDFSVEMVLIGKANTLLPFVTQAMQRAGFNGVGEDRGRFTLTSVEVTHCPDKDDWQLVTGAGPVADWVVPGIPPCPHGEVVLHLITPLRLTADGRPLGLDQLAFHHLFRNVLRRISMLTHFHGTDELAVDFAALSQAARTIQWKNAMLKQQPWSRYSSRQARKVRMDGVTGTTSLSGADLAPFWPILWFGQWVHAGKGASMGLGQYRLVSERG